MPARQTPGGGAADPTAVRVGGHRLNLTNLDKVLYPQTGTTKAEVLRYYAMVAPVLLPVLAGRPVTRKRWPHGVGAEPFFVKNLEPGAPSWIPRESVAHSDRPVVYPLADTDAVLTWMAQMAALELHVPQWRFAAHLPGRPDRMVFDLDPGPGVGLADCARVARWVREVLAQAGSDAVPVTSGSKGLHLYVPLDGSRTSDEVSATAKSVAQSLEAQHPALVTSKMARAVRPGWVFVDWSQNNGAKTTIAPYSLRGRDGPTVAAPRTWDEIDDPDLRQLDLEAVLVRLDEGLDPWAAVFGGDDADGPTSSTPTPGTSTAGSSIAGTSTAGTSTAEPPARGSIEVEAAGPDADTRAAAAAYAIAGMSGSDGVRKQGHHRWADPTEGPRGRVKRREFGTPGSTGRTTTGRTALVGGPSASGLLPMLATSGAVGDVGDGDGWRFEGKWDGIRAVAEVGDGAVRLIGRSGRELTAGYPELAELADLLDGHHAVLDGEIVTLDGDGRTSFPLLQPRMNLASAPQIARMIEQVPVRWFGFDLLEIDGTSLLRRPYDIRRRLLTALELEGEHIEVPAALEGDVHQALHFTREHDWEGIIAKRGDSVYRPGARSAHWLKIKNQRMQEVVVIGWRPGAGRRSGGIGSLLVAVGADDGRLRYAGRVGTGFTDAALRDLQVRVGERTTTPSADVPREDARDAIWVEPVLVGEVSFTEWTPDGKLRAPSWRGLRDDKAPEDVREE